MECLTHRVCDVADHCESSGACLSSHMTEEDRAGIRAWTMAEPIPVGPTIALPIRRGFYVYKHLDSNGTVLYVGYTTTPTTRTANHIAGQGSRSVWWPFVHSIEWERYEDEHAAKHRESELIRLLSTRYNIVGSRRPPAEAVA